MRKRRNVAYYSARIAKEMGIPEKQVHAVLMHCWRNFLRALKRKENINIQGFASFWIDRTGKSMNPGPTVVHEPEKEPWDFTNTNIDEDG